MFATLVPGWTLAAAAATPARANRPAPAAATPGPAPAAGRVVLDGSVGNAATIQPVAGDYAVPATAGRQVGANLFHSFTRLDPSAGESVTFTGPSSVHTVMARVTGGAASNIDGTLRCTTRRRTSC